MRCDDCPSGPAGRCGPVFCEWFHSGDPVKRAHVVALSALPREEETPGPPPLLEQAGNLAGSIGRFVAGGLVLSTPGETARRLAICAECEYYWAGRCKLCGCRLGLKVNMQTEKCPIAKW